MFQSFRNAALLRCPRCGGRDIMTSWFRFRDRCPTCDLRLDRDESGYQVGSYFVAITMLFALFALLFVVILRATWPDPPWRVLQWGGLALMVAGPLLLYPFTKTFYLAFDLTLRPDAAL
jgi:uncharacterized protein (DUF983 family)